MRNVAEHKKLLSQVAELERDSTNFFDVEKEFFLIDSNNLSAVKTRLYGYSIQADGIYEDDNLTPDAVKNLDGRGCYVYVEARDDKITIKQDLNGSWGLYLFRHGGYFALSNSFFRLLDHVKFRYPLTVNRDYCNYFMINGVSINSYSETAVNEIKFLVRNATLHIDMVKKDLQIALIDYKEHSIPLDSEEGVAILDRWVDFWSNVMRGITAHTKFFQVDLSGGFDTRISLVPLLNSDIDLNDIRVYSSTDDNPIALEDYAIASQIANCYGFKLNKPLPKRKFLNYSLNDMWNSDLYHQQTIRNLYGAFFTPTPVEKLYCLKGLSGEVMRKTWHTLPKTFLDNLLSATNRYSRPLARELAHSVQNFIESIFRAVRDKYKIADVNSVDIPQYLYHETRTRNHCGKEISGHFLKNTIIIAPALDPEVQTLQLKSLNCPDYNFLMVFLFARYAPDLLKIPFDKYHEPVALETIVPYVKKINERFPRNMTANKLTGGGYFICSRVTCKRKKLFLRGRITKAFPATCPKLA